MEIRHFVAPSNITLDLRVPTGCLPRRAGPPSSSRPGLGRRRDSTCALLKREELGSTGTAGGVALPHARLQGLTEPFGLLARLSRAIDFEAVDGKPVDIVLLVLLPLA